MSEKRNLAQSVAAFTKKFSKLNDEDKELQQTPLSKDKILQEEIKLREAEREESLRRRFSDFMEPRTQDIEQDEENLLQAYQLFCKLQDLCEATKQEKSTARLHSLKIESPLCKRDDYTLSENMAFLRLWFLQTNPDANVVPEFIRDENGLFYLEFTDKELWTPNSLEKEITTLIGNY
ncbi:hypothetical protein [Treponema bryantii]|uniref:hypothetical protein n=1 Tax=Treponema bryantii TaxID=163 RepID=UPI0003B635F1|nr:hypothetical protein [Treponema bryantii]